MGSLADLSPLFLLMSLCLAVLELLVGIGIGWWLRTTHRRGPGDDQELLRTKRALSHLHDLATTMAADVGEHSSRVQQISKDLNSQQETSDGQFDPVMLETVAQIIQANERLQKQLATAENKLQQQAQQIQVHASDALTDPLTGAANRRAFDRELAKRLAEWQRRQTPLSLLMVDVDHFKKFNDEHGHQAGDEVLRGVARVLHGAMSDVDVVARYGGEEFAVIMPGKTLAEAGPAAERARAAIEAATFNFQGKDLKVTASEGIAQAMPGEDIAKLVKRADEALYASKEAGRNRVHLHDGEISELITAIQATNKKSEPAPPPAAAVTDKPATPPPAASGMDAQTGLPNRTAFFEDVRHRVAESQRYGAKLSLMIIRIDNLAEITQKQGKPIGDLVLRTVTQFLKAALREMDVVARYEDEAFGVLVPTVALTQATAVADRLRTAISRCPLRLKQGDLNFTVSVGLSEATPKDDSASLVKRADAASRASVKNGRNCTHFHDGEAIQRCPEPVAAAQ